MPELITAADEARFDRQVEKHFRSHRDTPNGRNFATWNHPNFAESQKRLRENFDQAFPEAPGSDRWMDKIFCPGCGKRYCLCQCGKQ